MSSITVETVNLTGPLKFPVLTQAEIDALTDLEAGMIVYNSDINYLQIRGPFDNWAVTNIGTGNDLWSLGDDNEFTFKPIVDKGDNQGPGLSDIQNSYVFQTPAASNIRFFYQAREGFQTVAMPKDGLYEFEVGGARGGKCQNRGLTDIYGAKISGEFYITKDTRISFAVGSGGGDYSSPHGNEAGGGGATWIYDETNETLLMCAGAAGGSAGNTWGTSCTRDVTIARGQTTQGVQGFTCYTAVSAPAVGEGGNAAGGTHYGAAGGGYLSDGANGGTHCATAVGGKGFVNGLKGGTGNTCYTTGGLANSGGFGGGGGGQLSGPGGGGGYTGGCTAGQWSSYSTHGGGGGSYNASTGNTSATAGGNTGSEGGYGGAGYVKMTWLSE